MNTDGLQVTVRPRGVLECLDLAVMYCGRRPLAVATATALGALPCILVNRSLLAAAPDDSVFAAWLVLGLETAWAAVPLTLYLGQSVFSDRFSWRDAVRACGGGLPALILFQGMLRAVCLLIWVLAPVVFVGMYYLDQIILLERPPLRRVWARRSAINRRQAAHVLRLACTDATLLAVGTILGIRFLGAITQLWQGRGIGWEAVFGGPGGLVSTLVTWHGQIAFWAVCGFLTVFRFFTYLDARIRREGWDVELRLRADETYAGLEADPAPRRAGGVAAVIATVLLATLPALTQAADDDGPREALARQSFPWYDSAADRYRPLVRPQRPAREQRVGEAGEGVGDGGNAGGRGGGTGGGFGSGSGRGSGAGSGRGSGRATRTPALPPPPAVPLRLDGLGWVVLIALLVVGIAVLMHVIIRSRMHHPPDDVDGDALDREADADGVAADALPAGVGTDREDLLARAAASADRGDFATASVLFHAWLLLELDRRGGLALARGKTNGQYRAEVARAAPAAADLFAASCRLFEDAFFGRLPVAAAAFRSVWDRRRLLGGGLVLLLCCCGGCERDVDTDYGTVRGDSINGVAAFVQLLRDTGHDVTARDTLPERIDREFRTTVIVDDSFTGLPAAAADVVRSLLADPGPQTVLLVLRDSDAVIDYLQTILEDAELPADRRAAAAALLDDATTALREATAAPRSWTPPFADELTVVERPHADATTPVVTIDRDGREARIAAEWPLRRRLRRGRADGPRWSAGADPLLVRRLRGADELFVLASAAPILNGGLVDPGNRQLAAALAELLPREGRLLLAGSSMSNADGGGGDEEPSAWRLLTVPPLPWVAAQAVLAIGLFCWSTAPIFGRPRRSRPDHAHDFGHHVAAIAALFARSPAAAAEFSERRLEAWRQGQTASSRGRRRPWNPRP